MENQNLKKIKNEIIFRCKFQGDCKYENPFNKYKCSGCVYGIVEECKTGGVCKG